MDENIFYATSEGNGGSVATLTTTEKVIANMSELVATANAIREKTGSTSELDWLDGKGFAESVAEIKSGGSGENCTVDFYMNFGAVYYMYYADDGSLVFDNKDVSDYQHIALSIAKNSIAVIYDCGLLTYWDGGVQGYSLGNDDHYAVHVTGDGWIAIKKGGGSEPT